MTTDAGAGTKAGRRKETEEQDRTSCKSRERISSRARAQRARQKQQHEQRLPSSRAYEPAPGKILSTLSAQAHLPGFIWNALHAP